MSNDFIVNELYHHGILGMKWGKKNGPPYPLDAQDHSASEKKAGWRKSLDTRHSTKYYKSRLPKDENNSKGLTDKQKQALKVGAAIAATALIAYGGYKLKQSGKLDSLIEDGKKTVDKLLKNGSIAKQNVTGLGSDTAKKAAAQVDSLTGLKLGAKESFREAVSKVNPSGSNTNCRACSIANILRMRGFDVEAIGSVKGGTLEEAVTACFKGAKTTEIFNPTKEKVVKNILKFGEGSSGVMSAAYGPFSFEHAINWSVKDGIVSFFDGQDGSTDCSKLLSRMVSSKSAEISRLDNLEINLDGINKYIKNR